MSPIMIKDQTKPVDDDERIKPNPARGWSRKSQEFGSESDILPASPKSKSFRWRKKVRLFSFPARASSLCKTVDECNALWWPREVLSISY